MAISDSPTNHNFLNPNGYELLIRRLPYTNFFCQEVHLPGVDLPEINTANPFIKLNFSSTEISMGKLGVVFKVDEDMKNYNEILNWIKGLGFPEEFKQYSDNKKAFGSESLRSDASVIITTGSKVPNIDVRLLDIFPISLGPLVLATTDNKTNFLTSSVIFSVRDFNLDSIKECVSAE